MIMYLTLTVLFCHWFKGYHIKRVADFLDEVQGRYSLLMIMITILLFILGTLFISYDVALIISCPGTFLDNVISFSHVWSAVGL